MNQGENHLWLKPVVRRDKNIVYKGKKYLVDFQLLQQYSNYFYKRRDAYLFNEDIDISPDIFDEDGSCIEMFIKSIQNEEFSINDQNIYSLHQLSIIYDVPSLNNLTQEYINKHNANYVLKSIIYKQKLYEKNIKNPMNEPESTNTKSEEETIATNINEYIKNENLVKLPVSILYRILNHPNMNKQYDKEFEDFLFKCLKEHKKSASILFLNEHQNFLTEETLLQLINEYNDIFDFELVSGKDIVKKIKEMKMKNEELTNKLNETNINFEKKIEELNEDKNQLYHKINEIQKELDYYKRLVEEFHRIIPNKNDDECLKIIERDHQLSDNVRSIFKGNKDDDIIKFISKDVALSFNIRKFFRSGDDSWIMNQIQSDHERIQEIFELKTNITNLQNNINQLTNDKNKCQDIIKELETKEREHSKTIKQMKDDNQRLREENNKTIKQMKDDNEFCKNNDILLPNSMQKLLIGNIPSYEMKNKIEHLLNYLQRNINITEPCIEIINQNEQIQNIAKECEVKLLPNAIENLFNNKLLTEKEFIYIIQEFKIIQFEVLYPHQSFQFIYDELRVIQFNYKTKIEIGVQILPSLKSIENSVFYSYSLLTQITISSSVTSIGSFSFDSCTSLKKIEIPSSVKSIGKYAFSDCSSLTQVLIPSSVTSLGDYAFNKCSSLKQVSILSSLTSISEGTFLNCSSLIKISIPSSVSSIGKYAFSNCSSLTQISFPSSLKSIGIGAFSNCSSLTQISLPSSVTSIGESSFFNCTSLMQASIPSSASSSNAFPFNIIVHKF